MSYRWALWLSPRQWLRRLIFWGGAIAIGAVAILFAEGAVWVSTLFKSLLGVSPWLPFLVLPSSLALVLWLTRRFFPAAQGSGIPQTIVALRLKDEKARNRLLSLRSALAKIVL